MINVIENNKVDIYDYYNSIIDENNIINNIQEKSLKKVDENAKHLMMIIIKLYMMKEK